MSYRCIQSYFSINLLRFLHKMSDKPKNFAVPAPKSIRGTRMSMANTATTSKPRIPQTAVKDKNQRSKIKTSANTTLLGDADTTLFKQEGSIPDFGAENYQIAYGKFVRAMLEECIVDEKIEREETQIDVQMALLSDRFKETIEQLDKTNRRLKDINFVVEQKRLLDLKNNDCSQYYEMMNNSNAETILQDLATTEQACLDKLETRNMDFGYDKDSGHKKLLDAVNDAIEGLDRIKKNSKLDMTKFSEFQKTDKSLDDLEKDRLDIESLKSEFENKFPLLTEKLMKEASERIAKMVDVDRDSDSDED